ncbi:MAG: adenylate/guanylate cyclase domain-containing protein, partial [Silicimonas sp.]|nr:adenylate/guanylate cyclase domain-containing protein [Silicimonas sp.]
SRDEGLSLGLRVGVHSGHLVAGVMGRKRPHFDIWGGTVNMAHRLQATANRNTVQITTAARDRLGDMPLTPRGEIEMKGLGPVPCWQIAPLERA